MKLLEELWGGFPVIEEAQHVKPYIWLLVPWALMKRQIPLDRRNVFRHCPVPEPDQIRMCKRVLVHDTGSLSSISTDFKHCKQNISFGLQCLHSPECLQQAYLEDSVYVEEIAVINHGVVRAQTKC